MTRDGLTVGLYAGLIIQDYRLMPYDPGSLLRGAYAGGQERISCQGGQSAPLRAGHECRMRRDLRIDAAGRDHFPVILVHPAVQVDFRFRYGRLDLLGCGSVSGAGQRHNQRSKCNEMDQMRRTRHEVRATRHYRHQNLLKLRSLHESLPNRRGIVADYGFFGAAGVAAGLAAGFAAGFAGAPGFAAGAAGLVAAAGGAGFTGLAPEACSNTFRISSVAVSGV